MRALTVRQPWAWAIALGHKDIENRSWAPRLEPGELFAIHAARARPAPEHIRTVAGLLGSRGVMPNEFDFGAVVAVVRFAGTTGSSQSRWFGGPVAWVLTDAVALTRPIRCTGQLGLWKLPPRVEAGVRRRIGLRRDRRPAG